MQSPKAQKFIEKAIRWASEQKTIWGLLLVGSFARGTANDNSDLDLIFLAHNPLEWLTNYEWLNDFGAVQSIAKEDWGGVKTLRVFFDDSAEVEFNFAHPSWASVVTMDPGTLRVVADGAKILYDSSGVLRELLKL